MEEIGETSTVTTESSPPAEIELEPEPQSKVSEVAEEPEVAKESSLAEKPEDAKESSVAEKPEVAKGSVVSEEPEVAKESSVAEKPEDAKVASVTEKPEDAKVASVTEKPEDAKVASVTEKPEDAKVASVTEKPEDAKVASVTEKPEDAKVASVTEKPEDAKVASVTEKPEDAKVASVAEKPEVAKESSVAEKPEVAKESSVAEKPEVAKESSVADKPVVAKESVVSEEPDVAKVSLVSEEHDVTKESFASEEHDVTKESFASEEQEKYDVSKASTIVSEEQEGRSEQDTVNLESSLVATTVSDENILNLGSDSEPVLNLGGDDAEEQAQDQAPPTGFDDDDEEQIKPEEPDDEHEQLQELGEDELLLQEGEGGETKPEEDETKPEEEEGEAKPQEEEIQPKKSHKALEAAKKKGDKQERTSIDLIGGIRPSQYSAEEISVHAIRRSIATGKSGPYVVENIFGEARLELGPPVTMTPESSLYDEEEEQEEEGEESEEFSILAELGLQLKEKEPIDRDAYENEYLELKEAEKILRRKNGLLSKKLTEYYLRRKITRVFTDISIEMFEELLDKYENKMEDWFEIRLRTSREREAVDNELLDMVHMRDEQMEELKKSFRDMQDREFEIGHGLINTKTGKIISDKVIDRLLQRQQQKSEDIAKIRLAYIKRRDRIREIEQKIKSLETIGGTLHLMDFEQLKMENQNFTDKIEEREEELMKLRNRYSKAMLGLAHIREKVNIIEVEIEDLCQNKDIETMHVFKMREDLNSLKMQRDCNRAGLERLKQQTGILTCPDLLNDMEYRVKTKEILTGVLNDLKEKHEDNRIKLINIRKNLNITEQEQVKQMNALSNISSVVRGTFKYSVFK